MLFFASCLGRTKKAQQNVNERTRIFSKSTPIDQNVQRFLNMIYSNSRDQNNELKKNYYHTIAEKRPDFLVKTYQELDPKFIELKAGLAMLVLLLPEEAALNLDNLKQDLARLANKYEENHLIDENLHDIANYLLHSNYSTLIANASMKMPESKATTLGLSDLEMKLVGCIHKPEPAVKNAYVN